MFEARLDQADFLKKVIEAIKDLVQDCNFDCNDRGIALQAMDNSHVALVSMVMTADSFSPFRCDRNIALGLNLNSLSKIMRAAQGNEMLVLKAEDNPDVVSLRFESPVADRVSEYEIKLMDIDQDHLGIPDTEYKATVTMPSTEFQRITRDLLSLSESVLIEVDKDSIKFDCEGEIGKGSISIRRHTDLEDEQNNVSIQMTDPVALTFSLKYLANFCRATGLAGQVTLSLSDETPLRVEYKFANNGYLRFYLAPKIGEE